MQQNFDSIEEYTAEEERADNKLWRTVIIGEQEQRINMKAIEPYKKVISHGGMETVCNISCLFTLSLSFLIAEN